RHAHADGHDLPDRLVTEGPREGAGDFAVRLVDVGVAHAAGADLDEDLVRPGLRRRHLPGHPGAVGRWDDCGSHGNSPSGKSGMPAAGALGTCVGHHGTGRADEKCPPVGPSAGSKARRTASAAPSSTVCVPRWSFRSVAVYPGPAEFTLIGVSFSSKASCTVSMLRAALADRVLAEHVKLDEAGRNPSAWSFSAAAAPRPRSRAPT